MDNRNGREMEDIAKQVRSAISEAFQSMDLGQLNQTVKDTFGQTLDKAMGQIEQYRNKLEGSGWRRADISQDSQEIVKKPLEIRVKWRGRISGILFTVFGSIGTGLFGILALVILAIAAPAWEAAGWWLAGSCGVIAAGFGLMLWKGICQNGRVGRLKGYLVELKQRGKTYCGLEELSRSCGRSLKFMRKDLHKLISLGMLPDARMDEQKEWLMLDDETYQQYQQSKQALVRKQEEEKRREALKSQKEEPKEETAVEAAIRQGEEYMDTLDRLRESMPGEPVREKLLRLDTVLERLFDTLKKHPDQLDELEKFMEYYLPTTVKLVSTYQEFAAVEFPGENIKGARSEIEQTLDAINGAFERLLDDMYEDTAFDIITDASVLQTMLAREGMTEPDFSHRQ